MSIITVSYFMEQQTEDTRNLNMRLFERRGFVALMAVVVVGAVGLAIAISITLLGAGFTKTGIALQQSQQAKSLANACAEYGLEKLRESTGYAGDETLTIGSSTCYVLAVLGSGNTNRTVESSSTVGTVTRKVKVQVSQIMPQIQVTSWQEVADLP